MGGNKPRQPDSPAFFNLESPTNLYDKYLGSSSFFKKSFNVKLTFIANI